MKKNLIIEIETVNKNVYRIYKIEEGYILKSVSNAFKDFDFVLLKKAYIDDRINFIGSTYKNFEIVKKLTKYKIRALSGSKITKMNLAQTTSKIKVLKVHNHRLYKIIREKDNILLID